MKKISGPWHGIDPDETGLNSYDSMIEMIHVKELFPEKVKDHGFNEDSWNGYKNFIINHYNPPDLKGNTIARIMNGVYPIWHRRENYLMGYYDNKTDKFIRKDDKENHDNLLNNNVENVLEKTSKWFELNCKFSSKK